MEWFVMGCLGIGTFCERFLIGHFAGGLYFTFYPTPQGGGGIWPKGLRWKENENL